MFHIARNIWNTGNYICGSVSDKYVDTDGNQSGVRNVIQWAGSGVDGQQWIMEDAGNGYCYIRNLFGYYLDVENGTSTEGTNVRTWGFTGENAQKWRLIKVSGRPVSINKGVYQIQNANGFFLDLANGSADDGTNIRIWTQNGSAAQGFEIERYSASTGSIIKNVQTKKQSILKTIAQKQMQMYFNGGLAEPKDSNGYLKMRVMDTITYVIYMDFILM